MFTNYSNSLEYYFYEPKIYRTQKSTDSGAAKNYGK